MAFVDDYTAWITGPLAESNREGIEAIVARALDWEKRSGATFEGDKTTVMHFTRNASKTNTTLIVIKGIEVSSKKEVKVLGVVLDPELRYKSHIANAAAKGLKAAMGLKRLRLVSLRTARQLFSATVAPVADYASNVWSYACTNKLMTQLERVHRIGATAITRSVGILAAWTIKPCLADRSGNCGQLELSFS